MATEKSTISKLKKENESLKNELTQIKTLHEQLLNERKQENYDEWRVLLLKSQLIQVERQSLLLSEALGSRANCLIEVENVLSKLADSWRTFISQNIRGPDVPIPRAKIMQMVEVAESLRLKVGKTAETSSIESLGRPPAFKVSGALENFTLIDICSGKNEHLNLKHVSKLETKLFNLYKQLTCLQESLRVVYTPSNCLASPIYEHTYLHVVKSVEMTKEVGQDLLNLSVLFPAAPWPPIQKGKYAEITVANMMSKFPKLTPKYRQELKDITTAFVKAMNYSMQSSALEAKAVQEELDFHQEVYEQQLKYVNALFKALEESYSDFKRCSQELVWKPLKHILCKYDAMKASADEDTLKNFLTAFKNNEERLSSAIDQYYQVEQSSEESPLTNFHEDFLNSIEKVKTECRRKRDLSIVELEKVKLERESHHGELKSLFQVQNSTNS